MSDVLTHLWSSTLVLALALVMSRALPVTARTRYALVFCGLLKFAIPFAAINVLGHALGIDLAHLTARSAGSVSMQWLGAPLAVSALSPHPASRWPEALMIAWLVPAGLLAIFWAIARRRMVSSALHANSLASPREIVALAGARRRLGLRMSVEIRRSTVCEAPAVVRIIRPVVILPDGGCDALDDDELESVLRHECAHVARRDNLLSLGESAIVAAF
ncbi:MAG TPA: M56 family metallopeptidase, partial [Thermoanaerobaculia bacterium]